jgi:maleylacetoacetate isomerase
MKLYTFWRSSAAFRARIAINLKGLHPEQVAVHLRKHQQSAPDYLALNPQGLVPALEVDGRVIAQSLAIIEYLDEAWPEPPLLPRGLLDRALVRSMAYNIACDLHPLNNLRILQYLKQPLGHSQATIDEWYRHWVQVCFDGLERQARAHSGDGRHVYGASVTLADVCLVPQVYNARRFNCDLAAYPTLTGICAALNQLPAFAAAAPERQPDAEPEQR